MAKREAEPQLPANIVQSFVALAPDNNLREVVKANLGVGLKMSLFDLECISPAPGTVCKFTVAGDDGSESLIDEVIGVVPWYLDRRAFWKIPFEESGGGTPPDCSSMDTLVGRGDNDVAVGMDHTCGSCPQSQWGSGKNGIGQRCTQYRMVFVLRTGREDRVFPSIMFVTPGSLKTFGQYMTSLISRRIPFWRGLHRFSLAKQESKGGIGYGQMKCDFLRLLTPEEEASLKSYAEQLQALAGGLTVEDDSKLRGRV